MNQVSPEAAPASSLPFNPELTLGVWPGPGTGTVIGAYHLVDCVGQGGMGEVWLADQFEPVRRRVAVKLMLAGMQSRDALARFQSEVQALALMDHPAIARVYHAGVTAERRPYFTMEYVPSGIPITEYCDGRKLTIRDRLRLFVLVCEGVQHAHQKAVIHRDLKPSNILISKAAGTRGTPKIIDFGIAKALGTQRSSQTLCTIAGFPVGTPDYMSPEQAIGDGDIDTRSDIYSLGIVLYELLTGTVPFRSSTTKLPTDEFIRQIREGDAPRPSTKVRNAAEERRSSSALRLSDPQSLARELRGDLDAIVLKALEKDRDRRYSSASELAGDIGLYLQNLPVTASAPTAAYRMRKFVIRHRAIVGSATSMLLLLIAFATAMTMQTVRIAKERDRADRETAAARQTADFLANLFSASNPAASHGQPITARDLLDARVRQATAALDSAPIAEARLRSVMGESYRMMMEDDLALTQFNRALALTDAAEGPNSIDSIRSLDGLYHTQRDAGRPADAKATAAVMGRRVANLPGGSEGWIRATRVVAEQLAESGQPKQAETILRAVLVKLHQHRPQNAGLLERATLISLSRILRSESRYAEASNTARELVRVSQLPRAESDNSSLPESLRILASSLISEGKSEEALGILNQALREHRKIFGPDHVQTLWSEYEIGRALADSGRVDEGLTAIRNVARRLIALRGSDTPFALTVLVGLGSVLQQAGKAAEAESILRGCVAKLEAAQGTDGVATLVAEQELGLALAKLKRWDEAQALLEKVYAARQRVLGPEHEQSVESIAALGDLAVARSSWTTAEQHYRQAIELMLKNNMRRDRTQEYRYRLAELLMRRQDVNEALDLLGQAVADGFAHGEWLDASPAFASLRNTGGYQKLRQRMKSASRLAVLNMSPALAQRH